MKTGSRVALSCVFVSVGAVLVSTLAAGPAVLLDDWTLVGWNNLGMHCMDSDYSVFSILPPYNTICAHVIDQHGALVDVPAGTTVTYRASADPTGSINVSSAGKTNFWQHIVELFGANLPVDRGLEGNEMPGAANAARPMQYEAAQKWFTAAGIPITPVDDAGHTQNYPLMRLEVRDPAGILRGSTDIVLPVSSELDCRACHASGAAPDARPAGGWVNEANFERDYRLNILRKHDERQALDPQYQSALAHFGYNPNGLFATVTVDGRAILCGSCHGTNALSSPGFGTIHSLTSAIHAGHAAANDPITHVPLGSAEDRSACYRCHPGSETRCLRGAMGSAVAADGSLAMQCQDCHGNMAKVGAAARQGWFEEPACQSCHTGTATQNNGQIRYDTAFLANGAERQAVNPTFATNANTPALGLDLYRFSAGHGGLQCSACHGSTHAEYPSSHANDNLQSVAVQGHAGVLVECTACHESMPDTVTGGPHGMHPVGAQWAHDHADAVEQGGAAQCRVCHGSDYRGTVLSRSQAARTITTNFGQKNFWDGYEIGCYVCHNGPGSENASTNHPPVVANASAATPAGVSVPVTLTVSDADADATTLRIVSQPRNGTVSLSGHQARYFPFTGFAGSDSFTYAAADGKSQSQLGVVSVSVTANWENFGEGLAGTLGVPELTLGGVPALGSSPVLHIGNSAGMDTAVIVLSGPRSTYQPTRFGGTILVADSTRRVLRMPVQGLHNAYQVPSSPTSIGTAVILQTMVRDPAAKHGFAFSRGLRLVFGL